MRRVMGVFVVCAGLVFPTSASAQLSFMPKITTGLGVGADLAVRASDWVVIRAGGSFLPFEPAFTVAEIDWTVDAPIAGVGAVDVHIGGTGFRVSGGVFYLADNVVFNGDFTGEVEIGDETWTRSEVGDLSGDVGLGDFLPFVSTGYGHASGTGVGLFLEVGAAFFGESEVVLDAEGGTRSEDPDFEAAMRSQETTIEQELDDIGIWPILTVGIRIGAPEGW